MSNKVLDKGKIIHKLHQTQKQLNRAEEEKKPFFKSLIKKLQEKIYGKNKPNE